MNPLEIWLKQWRTRRQLLREMGTGLGMLGFASLLKDAGLLVSTAAAAIGNPLAPRPPQFPARAKRIIHIYLNGGPSQDRKSTRLNSSHLVISYAVFCLKKKKHTSELQSPCNLVCRLLL